MPPPKNAIICSSEGVDPPNSATLGSLPDVPDTLISGGGNPCVRFQEPVMRPGSTSSTLSLGKQDSHHIQHCGRDQKILMISSHQQPESIRLILIQDPQLKILYKNVLKFCQNQHDIVCRWAGKEFKKICKLKMSKLKSRYSVNAAIIFNSWLKYVDMCEQERNLTNMEVMQLVNTTTTDHSHGVVQFYLDMNKEW